jgi:hypothetical protein
MTWDNLYFYHYRDRLTSRTSLGMMALPKCIYWGVEVSATYEIIYGR